MYSRLPLRAALALTIAFTAACDDDDDPVGPGIDFDDIATQCVEGTVDDATETVFETGTINDDDCRISSELGDAYLEAYALPQTAFGTMDEIQIDLESDFDGMILVIDEDGNEIAWADDIDEGGSEQLILSFDQDPSEPDYYVVVWSFDGEDSGSYSLSFGPMVGGA